MGAAPSVHAHARLIKSIPAEKGEIIGPKAKIELWFNELLEQDFNSATVFPSSEINSKTRANLAKGKPMLDRTDKTHLTIDVEGLTPGEYVLEYRVLSRDGHSAPGRLRFKVVAPEK
jgi:methionine-rich copper-binding protein CopC